MSYNDGFLGMEPWIYNNKSEKFYMLKDMFSGQHGSNPSNFIQVGSFIYFTALDQALSRQWYRMDVNDITNLKTLTSRNAVKIFPNPGYTFWQSAETLHNVEIFDINGRFLLAKEVWQQGENWEISGLRSGQYLMMAKKSDGKSVHQVLMKIQD
jgi:ELWxxDGT repeat protein